MSLSSFPLQSTKIFSLLFHFQRKSKVNIVKKILANFRLIENQHEVRCSFVWPDTPLQLRFTPLVFFFILMRVESEKKAYWLLDNRGRTVIG